MRCKMTFRAGISWHQATLAFTEVQKIHSISEALLSLLKECILIPNPNEHIEFHEVLVLSVFSDDHRNFVSTIVLTSDSYTQYCFRDLCG